jgi:hypothetical protein
MLARVLLLAAGTLSGVVGVADAAYCHHGPSPTAPTNPQPVTIPQPYFVSAVANGSLWEVQVDDQVIPILHLYGTPYQKGYAHGQLMQAPMTSFIGELMSYLIDRAGAQLNKSGMPLPEAEKLATILIDDGLDLTSMETQPYTGDYYGEELQGMSDASGIPVDQLRRVQMLGELTKGSCSMYGAWDEALATQEGLLTMRALDWITDGPFQNHHQLSQWREARSRDETGSFKWLISLFCHFNCFISPQPCTMPTRRTLWRTTSSTWAGRSVVSPPRPWLLVWFGADCSCWLFSICLGRAGSVRSRV